MKSEEMEKVLNTLIQQLNKIRELLKDVQLTIINRYETNQDIIDNIPIAPRYMNYVVSTQVLQDAKNADAEMLDTLSNMQKTIQKAITTYKHMIKQLPEDQVFCMFLVSF